MCNQLSIMIKEVKKYLLVALLLLITYIAFLIVKPFTSAILASFALAYIFYPVHKKISAWTKKEIMGAIVTTILVIILIILPIMYISNAVVTESFDLYEQGIVKDTTTKLSVYFENNPTIAKIGNEVTNKFLEYTKQQATKFLSDTPSLILNFLVTIYLTFALFLVGEKFLKNVKKILPVKKKDELTKHIGETTYAIAYGLFVTAIIELVIALIAFKIIGTSAALLLALIIGFLAFIPFLGPVVIWLPYAIIEFSRSNTKNAIILIILGIFLFVIETFIRPKIIGDRAKLHPVIILIGTIGGIKIFGFIGLIVGPVILSTIAIIIKEYYPDIKNET